MSAHMVDVVHLVQRSGPEYDTYRCTVRVEGELYAADFIVTTAMQKDEPGWRDMMVKMALTDAEKIHVVRMAELAAADDPPIAYFGATNEP